MVKVCEPEVSWARLAKLFIGVPFFPQRRRSELGARAELAESAVLAELQPRHIACKQSEASARINLPKTDYSGQGFNVHGQAGRGGSA